MVGRRMSQAQGVNRYSQHPPIALRHGYFPFRNRCDPRMPANYIIGVYVVFTMTRTILGPLYNTPLLIEIGLRHSMNLKFRLILLTASVFVRAIGAIFLSVTEETSLDAVTVAAGQRTVRTQGFVGVEQRFDLTFLVLQLAIFDGVFPVARLLVDVEVETGRTTDGLKSLKQDEKTLHFGCLTAIEINKNSRYLFPQVTHNAGYPTPTSGVVFKPNNTTIRARQVMRGCCLRFVINFLINLHSVFGVAVFIFLVI